MNYLLIPIFLQHILHRPNHACRFGGDHHQDLLRFRLLFRFRRTFVSLHILATNNRLH